MTKDEKRRARWKYKTEQGAIVVCDRLLGRIPRDQTTLDALQAASVLIEAAEGTSHLSERQDRIYDHLHHEFEEACFDLCESKPFLEDEAARMQADDGVRAKTWIACQASWREIERRDNYGQDVAGQLEELTEALLYEIL